MSNVFVCPVCGDKYESIIDFSEHVNFHAETEERETRKKVVDDAKADFNNIIYFANEFEKLIEDFNTKFNPYNITLTTKYCYDAGKPDSINFTLSDEKKVYNAYNFSFRDRANSKTKTENTSANKNTEQDYLNELKGKIDRWTDENAAPEKEKEKKAKEPSLTDFMERYGNLVDKSKGIESLEPLLKKYAEDCNINVESEEKYGEFLDSLLTTGIAAILGEIFM